MILTTGEKFDRIRVESYPDYHGLIVEFQPDGHNAVSGSPVIEIRLGFVLLPSGQLGLSVQLPPDYAFKNGSRFVVINESTGAEKITIGEVDFERCSHLG